MTYWHNLADKMEDQVNTERDKEDWLNATDRLAESGQYEWLIAEAYEILARFQRKDMVG